MVARRCQGSTKIEHVEEYSQFMMVRTIPDYEETKGFVKLWF